ncbi:MAG: quinone-dependent dihydroorotate dehydrogenase [Saprospiraceae bacterium]|jgi:dihydroorotate dehydrogenase|nr:quinone-dependent dihydroorotate dehydrogenase [Saprospiraceae bacterium]
MYRLVFQPLLFLLSPEKAHAVALALLELLLHIPGAESLLRRSLNRSSPLTVAGIRFPNPVGIAAGFDKNGKHIRALAALGFGFIEVGTVTPRPQAGNPRPRLFRLPADRALINRMGFNNDGLEALIRQLQRPRPAGIVIGGNIGKNKDTPNEQAADDYIACFEALFSWVDYFAVNVSSPNTPNLRALQDREPLTRLLAELQQRNDNQANPKPIFLKIAPDLTDAQLDDIVAIVRETRIAGIIAANTTISRTGLKTPAETTERIGAGGLSGYPVRERSTQIVRYLRAQLPPPFAIIGVGGIDGPESAREKTEAGADLVQVYTGFVYAGPTLAADIVAKLK